jgi:hypothetical protein
MLKKLFKLSVNPLFVAGVLILITVIITVQKSFLQPETIVTFGKLDTPYNNYLIFKQSFVHLIENKDLYLAYKNEQMDYYKYSPTFSLFMAPFSILPDFTGLLIWNLLNCLILFFALWKLPSQTDKTRLFMLAFIFIELITSIQNSQSNGLIAGLIVFAFIFLEKKQPLLASLAIVFTIYIKIFGLVSLALFLFYPDKLKAVLYTVGWTLLLAILPLFVISLSQLAYLYQSWSDLLQYDHSISWGLSLAGWIHNWLPIQSDNVILILGIIVFFLPFLKYNFFNEVRFRLFFLSSILIWIVLFNYQAESPTYVIAITGVAIWFAAQKIKTGNVVLLILAFILTVLSPTDFFPESIRENYINPYHLKVLPCILIWLKITSDLMFYRNEYPQAQQHL